MRTAIKIIVASLGLMALHGTATAEDQMLNEQSRALYRSIAAQGDQALLDIRASVVGSISQFVNRQMAASLPQLAEAGHPNHSQRLDGNTDLTSIAMGH